MAEAGMLEQLIHAVETQRDTQRMLLDTIERLSRRVESVIDVVDLHLEESGDAAEPSASPATVYKCVGPFGCGFTTTEPKKVWDGGWQCPACDRAYYTKASDTEGDTTTYICTRHGPHSGPTCWLCVAHRERTTDDKGRPALCSKCDHDPNTHPDAVACDCMCHQNAVGRSMFHRPADDAGLAAAGDAATVAIQQKKLIAWCTTHRDLAWLYDDGSVGCYYCQVVETSSDDCEAVPLKLADGAGDALLKAGSEIAAMLTYVYEEDGPPHRDSMRNALDAWDRAVSSNSVGEHD